MAIGAYFNSPSLTKDKYDEIMRKLDQAGAGAPQGRQFHSCFQEGDGLAIYDVWDSQESLDAFFQSTLGAILQQVGVDPGEPSIAPMVNMVWGQH